MESKLWPSEVIRKKSPLISRVSITVPGFLKRLSVRDRSVEVTLLVEWFPTTVTRTGERPAVYGALKKNGNYSLFEQSTYTVKKLTKPSTTSKTIKNWKLTTQKTKSHPSVLLLTTKGSQFIVKSNLVVLENEKLFYVSMVRKEAELVST